VTDPSYTVESIQLWLDRLWDDDRPGFWAVVSRVGEPATNPHAKATFAQCVVDLAAASGDLTPLVAPAVGVREVDARALDTLSYVFEHACATASALAIAPWLEACEVLATSGNGQALTVAVLLLEALLHRPDLGAVRARVGACARALLRQAWEIAAPHAVNGAFASTIATIDTDVGASIKQLQCAIDDEHLAERRMLLRTLAWKAKEILAAGGGEGAALVARLYAAVGASVGKADRDSDEARSRWLTSAYAVGVEQAGPIPASIRSDLFEVGQTLEREELVRRFLRASPELAARTIADVLTAFESERPRDRTLTIRDRVVRVQGRANWPRSMSGLDATLTGVLCDELSAQAAGNPTVASAMIDAIAAAEAPIDLWQAVVAQSARSLPLLNEIRDLFACEDAVRLLSQAMSLVVAQHGAALPDELRDALIRTIDRLGDDGIDRYARDQVGAALRGETRPALDEEGTLLALEPDAGATEVEDALAPIVREHLQALGMSDADINAAPNRNLRRAETRARRLARELGPDLQGKVPLAEPRAVEAGRDALCGLVERLQGHDVHPVEVSLAWGVIGRLASALAHQGVAAGEVRDLLQRALERRPMHDGGKGDLLNRHADEACVTCVDGLVALAARGDLPAIEAVKRAAEDEEPATRFHVADRIRALAEIGGGCRVVARRAVGSRSAPRGRERDHHQLRVVLQGRSSTRAGARRSGASLDPG
jgi:hypothetical protein